MQARSPTPRSVGAPPAPGRPRILLVEDDAALADVVRAEGLVEARAGRISLPNRAGGCQLVVRPPTRAHS